MITPFIINVFFGLALLWASLALYYQCSKLYGIWLQGTNGHESLITLTYTLFSLLNAHMMHIILVASIKNINGESNYSSGALGFYIVISLLGNAVMSGAVSWLILSSKTIELFMAVKRIDTDDHDFQEIFNEKKRIFV